MKNEDLPANVVLNKSGEPLEIVIIREGCDEDGMSATETLRCTGMTKLEDFAKEAMGGLCANGGYANFDDLAHDAVVAAKAALAALEKADE